MAYVNFKNLPSEETPLTGNNGGNLNVMQENGTSHGTDTKLGYAQSFLNDHLVNVSNEVDEDYRVNFVKSKNLLDLQYLQLLINSSGTVISHPSYWDVIIDTRNINSLYVSGNFSLLADNAIRIGTYSSYPVLGSTGTRLTLQANGAINTSNVNYVLFAFGVSSSSVTWDQVKASFMINEGSTALPYEPYITPSIYVDNENIYSKPVVLWTNSSPTSDFAGQQITLSDSLNNYSYYEVLFLMSKYESMCVSTGLIPSNMNTCLLSLRNANNVGTISRYRDVVKDSNTILGFGSCSQCTAGSTSTATANDRVIPYQVIGYK